MFIFMSISWFLWLSLCIHFTLRVHHDIYGYVCVYITICMSTPRFLWLSLCVYQYVYKPTTIFMVISMCIWSFLWVNHDFCGYTMIFMVISIFILLCPRFLWLSLWPSLCMLKSLWDSAVHDGEKVWQHWHLESLTNWLCDELSLKGKQRESEKRKIWHYLKTRVPR